MPLQKKLSKEEEMKLAEKFINDTIERLLNSNRQKRKAIFRSIENKKFRDFLKARYQKAFSEKEKRLKEEIK